MLIDVLTPISEFRDGRTLNQIEKELHRDYPIYERYLVLKSSGGEHCNYRYLGVHFDTCNTLGMNMCRLQHSLYFVLFLLAIYYLTINTIEVSNILLSPLVYK